MATSNIKFSNNPQSLSFTATNVSANGQSTPVTQVSGYTGSAIAGKTVNQVQILNSSGGTQKLTISGGGQTKTAITPGFGDDIANFSPAVDVTALTITLVKQN